MKKTMMIAALFAASTLAASAADVYSSNIVGYTKVDVASGFNMLGTQFVNVGDNAALDINQLINTEDLPGLDGSYSYQTLLKKWTGSGYEYYGWLDADDGTGVGLPEWDSKWALYDMSAIAEVDMNEGEGFWIQTVGSATVTFSGQVSSNETFDVSVGAGFTMVCNPFPVEINIQEVQSTDLAGLDGSYSYQSFLKTWTGSGYEYYGWLDGDDGTGVGLPEWDSKWALYDMSAIANVTIGIGEAFWIQTSAPATITFTK